MVWRKWLFQKISGLSRGQKRAVFLSIDALFPPTVFAAMYLHALQFQDVPIYVCLMLLVLVAALSSTVHGLTRIKLNSYGRDAIFATVKYTASCMVGLLVFGTVMLIPLRPFQVIEFGTVVFIGSLANRFLLLAALLWVLRQGHVRQRVLIYGAGATGLQMAQALRHHPTLHAVAFLDDDIELQGMHIAGLRVLSPTRLNTHFHELAINRVLLALPSAPVAKLTQITRKLLEMGLEVQALPSFEKQYQGSLLRLP